MKDGFITVACGSPKLKVADVAYNAEQIIFSVREAAQRGAKIIVFPELSLTAYTAGDLFYHGVLVSAAENALKRILAETAAVDAVIFVGLPFNFLDKNYNVAAAIFKGKILALIPKTYLPNYN